MKASNLTTSLLIAGIPAIVLFISGLDSQGLINAGIATAVVQLLNVIAKTIQERNTTQPPVMSTRGLEPVVGQPSLLVRVLFK